MRIEGGNGAAAAQAQLTGGGATSAFSPRLRGLGRHVAHQAGLSLRLQPWFRKPGLLCSLCPGGGVRETGTKGFPHFTSPSPNTGSCVSLPHLWDEIKRMSTHLANNTDLGGVKEPLVPSPSCWCRRGARGLERLGTSPGHSTPRRKASVCPRSTRFPSPGVPLLSRPTPISTAHHQELTTGVGRFQEWQD